MAVYTNLSHEDITKILLKYDLNMKTYNRIKSGILNTNYFLDCTQGKFVMRVFEGGRTFEEEDLELKFLLELRKIIPCCIPKKTLAGENYSIFNEKMVAIFYFIEGTPIKKVTKELIQEIGKYLGILHRFSNGLVLERKSRIDMETYYNRLDFNLLPISEDDKKKIKKLYLEIKKFNFSKLPTGIIHSDIFPDNVFEKNGKIEGILDFNEAHSGAFLDDIAIVINYWIRLGKFSFEQEKYYTELFFQEYERERKITDKEWEALDKALIKMALTFILLRFDKFILQNLKGIYIEDKNYKELLPLLNYY